eukprot:2413179-Amphidinium_carterae.4
MENQGVYVHVIDSQAPHQQGKTERAGGALKRQVLLALEETDVLSPEEFHQLVYHAVAARDKYIDRSGYSADQRVFGTSTRFPRDMLSDELIDADALALDTKGDMVRATTLRAAALSSLFKLEAKTRLERAAAAKLQTYDDIKTGDWVFVLRRNAFGRTWRQGPGIVVMMAGASAWMTMRGELFKVAVMNLRKATSQEKEGIEVVNELLPELREVVLKRQRSRRFRDLTPETLEERPTSRRRVDSASTRVPESEERNGETQAEAPETGETEQGVGDSSEVTGSEGVNTSSEVARIESATSASDASAGTEYGPLRSDRPGHRAQEYVQEGHSQVKLCSPTDGLEVTYERLSEEERKAFDQAIATEVGSMLRTNAALEVLTWEESNRVRREEPDRIVRSRYYMKWKEVDTPEGVEYKAKCRWILIGFEDPDFLWLDGRAPSPQLSTVNLFLVATASLKRTAYQGDLSQAFLQGKPAERVLYVSQPSIGVPGMCQGQLLIMKKEIYGSMLGPAAWRKSFVEIVLELGYRQAKCDECLFVLRAEGHQREVQEKEGVSARELLQEQEWLLPRSCEEDTAVGRRPVKGLLLILTDDVLTSGDEDHEAKMQVLKSRLRCGKYTSLKQKGGGIFNGRRLQQMEDSSFKCHMRDYILRKLPPVVLSGRMKKQKEQEVNEKERPERGFLRGMIMKLMWIARECRPDIQGTASLLARSIHSAKVEDLIELSKAVQHLRETADLGLVYASVSQEDMRLVVAADASPSTAQELHAQAGTLVALAQKDLLEQGSGGVLPVMWRSGKIERVCNSSLSAEAYAMVGAVAAAEWAMQAYLEMTLSAFRSDWARERLYAWESNQARDLQGLLIARDGTSEELKSGVAITDAKSLYDALRGQAKGKEPRVALATVEIKQGMAMLGLAPRWVPHNHMLVDSLTKKWTQCSAVASAAWEWKVFVAG